MHPRVALNSVPRWTVIAVLVCLSAGSAVIAKRSTTVPAPVLAAVELPAAPVRTVEVIAASVETHAVTDEDATIIVEEIEDPLQGRSTETTTWTDENGVEWHRAPEGFERYYNGRPLVAVRTIHMTTTAYSPDHRSCGIWADGKTASMKSVWTNAMELVAADRRVLDFGTLISIPGYAEERAVPVLDVGGAIKGNRLDLLYATHNRALKWGVQRLPVTVWAYADEIEAD